MRQNWRGKVIVYLSTLILLLTSCTSPTQSPADFINQTATRHGGQVSGMAFKVFTSDEVIFANFYGYANEAQGLAIDEDTVFKWGSITKSLTWIAILQLMEQGEIDIHADIRTYISDDFLPDLIYPTTIYHLMTHSSGFVEGDIFRYYIELIRGLRPQDNYNLPYTIIGYTLRRMEMPQRLSPGVHRGDYSHYNVILASYIVEQISGRPFYEHVHDIVFDKLNMAHTSTLYGSSDNVWVRERMDRQACYSSADRRLEAECYRLSSAYMIGGVASTITDFHRFAMALMLCDNGYALFENHETLLKLHRLFEYEIAAFTDPKSGIIALNGQMCHTATVLLDTHRGMGVIVMTNQENEGFFNRVSFLGDVIERFSRVA